MKDLIKKALKTKFPNLGFSDKTFESVADYLLNTVTEESQIETAVSGVESILKAFQGDNDKLRTDKTNAEKKVTELEAKIKTQSGSGSGNPETQQQQQEQDDTPSWAKGLLSRLDNLEKGKAITERQKRFDELTDGISEQSKKAYSRIKLDAYSDDEFEALIEELKPEMEDLKTSESTSGSGYQAPKGGGGTPPKVAATKEESEQFTKSLGL